MGGCLKPLVLEVRQLCDGRIQARRRDGRTLSQEERFAAKLIAYAEQSPLNALLKDEIRCDLAQLHALLMYSYGLDDEFWLILDRSFVANDGSAFYYPDEIRFLKGKNTEQLKEIHKAKLSFPNCKVVQDGPDGSA